jgi:hypothetical protein
MKLKEKQGIEYKDPCKKGCLTHRYHCGDCNRALSYSPANYCSRPADIPNPCPKCNAQFYQACSPLQEPRENKLAKAMLKANKVFYTKQQTIKVLPPQPEKTDYQKRIEEILEDDRLKHTDGSICLFTIHRLLALLQEVRSEALEAQEKRIVEIIGGMKKKNLSESKTKESISYNQALSDVLSKLKEV